MDMWLGGGYEVRKSCYKKVDQKFLNNFSGAWFSFALLRRTLRFAWFKKITESLNFL